MRVAAGLAILLASSAAAAEPPALPGLATGGSRVAVAPDRPPWDAIVKVQTNIGTRCTGVLITAATVATAAHCLYNKLTRAMLQPISLHVLIGYQRGGYRVHLTVAHYRTGEGADWAVLDLAAPAPADIAPLPLAMEWPAPGGAVAFAGYNQDRAQILLADLSCHVTGFAEADGMRLIAHDCAGTRGTSGGPLLQRRDAGWEVVGIEIAAAGRANLAFPAAALPR